MSDASFKDGKEKPLKLLARDKDDLAIISTFCQDAIAERKEMLFEANKKTFSLLLRRFRWEDADEAERLSRPFERVQSVLMIRSVEGVKTSGFHHEAKDLAFELIGIRNEGDFIYLSFAGEGELAAKVECVDVVLADVSRPYTAKSKMKPDHKEQE